MEKQPPRRSTATLLAMVSVATLVSLMALLRHYLVFPAPNVQSVDLHPHKPSGGNLQLKHIFHHGTGAKTHRVHRRLDVTSDYLARHSLDSVQMFAESQDQIDQTALNSLPLDQIYTNNDWPRAHDGKNPWTMSMEVSTDFGSTQRLRDRHVPLFIDSYLEYAREVRGKPAKLNQIHLDWVEDEISLPNVTDRNTLVTLATISSNAYVRFPKDDKEKKKLDWIDLGDEWNPDKDHPDVNFGWDDIGLRGHVFVLNTSNLVVIGIKGTSGAALPGGGSDETGSSDKTNDNLLFSCCCARVSYLWTTVCDCYEKAYTCNQDCLEKELLREDRYYQAALEIYRNVTELYPPDQHEIWVTGHSLGGALALLLGRTYGLPAVAFEAPGEMLATKRLHLPQPPGIPKFMEHIWHIGNTADPIYMGVCNGASSSCSVAGYAMETACHTGKVCVYDVVTDKGWSVNLLNHRIHTVIDEVILAYNDTAPCVNQPPCRDCFNWRFVSHSDESQDDPKPLPNPLKPHPTHTTESSAVATTTSSSLLTPGPRKCLKRTWYGYCEKWSDE